MQDEGGLIALSNRISLCLRSYMLPAGVLAMTAPESPALAVLLVAVLGVLLAWLYEVELANLHGVWVAVVAFLLSILLKGPDEPVANGWLVAASFALMVGSILLKPAPPL